MCRDVEVGVLRRVVLHALVVKCGTQNLSEVGRACCGLATHHVPYLAWLGSPLLVAPCQPQHKSNSIGELTEK